jgi:hypothetical protein
VLSFAEWEGLTEALNQVQTSAITEQKRPNAINPSPVEDLSLSPVLTQIPKPAL